MAKTSEHPKKELPNVLFFQPLVGLVLAATGIVLHILFPFQIIPESIVATIVGIIVLIVGIGLQVICIRIFKQAKTTPLFQKPVSNILQTGPYAKSRNPIYIAVFLQFLGLAFLINTWWLILVLSILYVYLRFGVIAREESYLLQRFQDEYRTYQSKVPRWL